MGGLAPDNDQPMDESLQRTIAEYWYQIEEKTKVSFNHEYWRLNTPFRSTYLACRAVIAAQKCVSNGAQLMIKAIQSAYYSEAQNPSLATTLIDCATSIGINAQQFSKELNAKQTESRLQQHLMLSRQLQVGGFPALFYITNESRAYPLTWGFWQSEDLVARFEQVHQPKQ